MQFTGTPAALALQSSPCRPARVDPSPPLVRDRMSGQLAGSFYFGSFHDNTHAAGKIVSLFEPDTEIVRKG
jgi:hypothetical protein